MISNNDWYIIVGNNNGETSNGWSWGGIRADGIDLIGFPAVLKAEFSPHANQRLTIEDNTVDCTVVVASNGQGFPDLDNPNDGMIEFDMKFSDLERV